MKISDYEEFEQGDKVRLLTSWYEEKMDFHLKKVTY